MANWSFRKRIRILPGVNLNLSRSGVGISAGVRGFRIGKDARGRTYRAMSIPGTGIYSREYHTSASPTTQPITVAPGRRSTGSIVLILVVLFLIATFWKMAHGS